MANSSIDMHFRDFLAESFDHSRLPPFILFTFLVTQTVSLATTTQASRLIIEPVRLIAFILFAGASVYFLYFRRSLPISALVALLIAASLLLYGFSTLLIAGASLTFVSKAFLHIVMIVGGIFALSIQERDLVPRAVSFAFVWFGLVALLVTALIGGLEFGEPPRFNFGYQIALEGSFVPYSQGMAHFCAVCGLCSFSLISTSRTSRGKLAFTGITGLFLMACFLAGARGEMIAFLSVILLAGSIRWPLATVLVAVVGSLLLSLLIVSFSSFQEIVLVQRMAQFWDGIGQRAELIYTAFLLLEENMNCVFMGCGFSYFKYWVGGQGVAHPHLYFLDFAMSFGAPITFLVFGLFSVFVIHAFATTSFAQNTFLLLLIFCVILGLKSGTFLEHWFLTSAICVGVGVSLTRGFTPAAVSQHQR